MFPLQNGKRSDIYRTRMVPGYNEVTFFLLKTCPFVLYVLINCRLNIKSDVSLGISKRNHSDIFFSEVKVNLGEYHMAIYTLLLNTRRFGNELTLRWNIEIVDIR